LKKALAAALIVGVTLIIPGAAFAEKLPGGRPPCSIYRKAGGPSYDSFCNSFPWADKALLANERAWR